jgi:hypothetical protein
MRAILNDAGDSAETVSVRPTRFQLSSTALELSFVARKTKVPPPFYFTALSFDKVVLAFK